MRRAGIPALLLAASLPTACAGSTASVKPAIAPAPAELTAPCPSPRLLPGRALTQAEVERHWGADRAALVACRDRHGALVFFVAESRKGLIGGK